MPRFETIRPVRHSPQVMFDLVADIERYPEFVPMCEALHVRRRSESGGSDGSKTETLLAELMDGLAIMINV